MSKSEGFLNMVGKFETTLMTTNDNNYNNNDNINQQ